MSYRLLYAPGVEDDDLDVAAAGAERLDDEARRCAHAVALRLDTCVTIKLRHTGVANSQRRVILLLFM